MNYIVFIVENGGQPFHSEWTRWYRVDRQYCNEEMMNGFRKKRNKNITNELTPMQKAKFNS
jgi:hypothetical protein